MSARFVSIILAVLLGCINLYAQVPGRSTIDTRIYFEMNSDTINFSYMDNGVRLKAFKDIYYAITDQTWKYVVDFVSIKANYSPDGEAPKNRKLGNKRLSNIQQYLNEFIVVTEDKWISTTGDTWQELLDTLETSNVRYRDHIISVIKNTPYWVFDENGKVIGSRLDSLKRIEHGMAWQMLKKKIFPYLRYADISVIYSEVEPSEKVREYSEEEEDPDVLMPQIDTVFDHRIDTVRVKTPITRKKHRKRR